LLFVNLMKEMNINKILIKIDKNWFIY
jgi:hypothetical protein